MAGTVKHSHITQKIIYITMVNTHVIIILKYGNSVRITHIHKTYYNSFRVNELTKRGHKLTGQNQHRHQKDIGNIAGTVKHSHVTRHHIHSTTIVNNDTVKVQ